MVSCGQKKQMKHEKDNYADEKQGKLKQALCSAENKNTCAVLEKHDLTLYMKTTETVFDLCIHYFCSLFIKCI